MTKTPLSDLPEYWQVHIHNLRSDRANLRKGLVTPDDIDSSSRALIVRLRREAARSRTKLKEAREEIASLRAELAALNG